MWYMSMIGTNNSPVTRDMLLDISRVTLRLQELYDTDINDYAWLYINKLYSTINQLRAERYGNKPLSNIKYKGD